MPASRKRTTSSKTSPRSKGRATTRRKSANKEPDVQHELPGGFWRQILAVLMIALALFLCFTWFGHGGEVLNTIHSTIMQGIGFATYFLPFLLVYLAVKIFRAEGNRVAIVVYLASILMLLWVSGIAAINGNGGIVGKWLNDLMINLLDQNVVIFIYIVLIFITFAFLLQVSPLTLFKDTKNLVTPNKKPAVTPADSDDTKAKGGKLGQLEIKVNSGLAAPAAEAAAKPAKVRGFLHKAPRINMPATPAETAPKPTIEKPEEKALVAETDPDWKMPTPDLLSKKQSPQDPGNVKQNAFIIQKTFSEFGIEVEMEDANVGPRVTQYTLRAPGGVNLAKIAARDKELAYNLSAQTVRIEAPIPGTQLIGVEVPNVKSASVSLRGIIESSEWRQAKDPLTFSVGKDISGRPVVANLASMPHLLIAGTTGSGKSVMTNTIIMSLLYRNAPSEMRMIIVDPKQVEMVSYNDIPHLLTPVITDTSKALSAMKWAVGEMDRRYSQMAEEKVKKITDYNAKMEQKQKDGIKEGDKNTAKMPYIVIIIDEMSDLMMQASKELEPLIVRIAQLGRAAGMHLILATQKPIVKVITGLIKGNIPSRIAFRVTNSMESRIILDSSGAEKLLGQGDMLLSTEKTMNGPERIQGAWTPDEDIEKVTDFLRAQRPPQYNDEVIAQQVAIKGMSGAGGDMGTLGRTFDPQDPLVRKAVEISLNKGKFSTAMLQTYLGKGHGYVSGLAIWFEEIGVIGPQNGNKPRDLLITSLDEFDQISSQGQE
ncbi:DNA translocase FtsK 4TM domain-containing protein [Candidatus Saccharibacteria bacterium]|nr:DNA translocase FtsK 4TM domain-containing protein [Candidatus Saccharibacteria bacterium]